MSQHNDAENSVNGPAETEKVNNQVNTEESVGENTETNTEESTENRPNEEIYLSKDYALRDPVQRDERQVSDECDDYVFKIPKKHRTHTSSSSGSHHHHHHHGHHHHHHHKKKMKTWKKVLIAALCTLIGLVVAFTGTLAFLIYKGEQELKNNDYSINAPDSLGAIAQNDGQYISYNGGLYKYKEDVINMMFMGVDKRSMDEVNENQTGGQSDVDVIMAMDTLSNKIYMINIPRDTMTDIPVYDINGKYVGMEESQLCLAYAYGDGKASSCANVVSAVQNLFYNIPINLYFSLDLDGISEVNDSVGGVDVVSPSTIGDFHEGITYHLEGVEAENFVRTRDSEDVEANLERNSRQQVYVESFMKKFAAKTKQDITTPVNLFNATAPYSCTNLSASTISYLSKNFIMGSGMDFEILNIPGDMSMGDEYAEYRIREEEFFEQFLSVFYDKVA